MRLPRSIKCADGRPEAAVRINEAGEGRTPAAWFAMPLDFLYRFPFLILPSREACLKTNRVVLMLGIALLPAGYRRLAESPSNP